MFRSRSSSKCSLKEFSRIFSIKNTVIFCDYIKLMLIAFVQLLLFVIMAVKYNSALLNPIQRTIKALTHTRLVKQ